MQSKTELRKVFKQSGYSLAVTIPHSVIEECGIKAGDMVIVGVEKAISVRKSKVRAK